MNRLAVMLQWSLSSPAVRAAWFRSTARQKVIDSRETEVATGYHRGAIEVFDHEEQAIDDFARLVIEQSRDDDEATRAAEELMFRLRYAAVGSVADILLFHKGGGPRVRGAILKAAWTDGHSGSPLALRCPNKKELVEYFAEAGTAALMDDDELSVLASLPSEIQIYRGAKRKPGGLKATAKALSWTHHLDTAKWFAENGYGDGEPVVIETTYPKEHVLALWETSGREPEVVIDPYKLGIIRRVAN